MLEVLLHPLLASGQTFHVRELCGQHEQVSPGAGSVWSTALLDRLLVDAQGAESTGRAWSLTLAQRDHLVAELHIRTFGDLVESHVPCGACGTSFELAFSLRELRATRAPTLPPGVNLCEESGVFSLRDLRFRLPTTRDERDLAQLGEVEQAAGLLQARCIVQGDVAASAGRLPALIEALGPVLDLDLSASCPHCQNVQSTRFDVVSFFAACLRKEAPLLNAEIHLLASSYHWSLSEILSLPRSQRRALVTLIQAERRGRRREVARD